MHALQTRPPELLVSVTLWRIRMEKTMQEPSRNDEPQILDYAPARTERQGPDLLGASAFGSVVLAWFWLFVLSTNAWALSLAFGVLGCVAAVFRLSRRPLDRSERWVLVVCLIVGASACILALI